MIHAGHEIDLDVFRRYAGRALPRHVAYPMPTWWRDVEAAEAEAMLRESRQRAQPHDLSLYLHVPFCERICRYCACNRVGQPRSSPNATQRTDAYVAALVAELGVLGTALGERARVKHMHWGGGTPTYLSCERLVRVHEAVREHFDIAADAEIAIELDPRSADETLLEALRRAGFTRVSLGVQDFNPQVQEHVRRIQPLELVRETVATCRAVGFDSINFDLIYGLPYQTPETIRETLAQTIALSPDRIAYYQFARIPDKIAVQRGLDYDRLPDSQAKLEMLLLGIEAFTAAGYEFIGLDHFARPDESLARALHAGTLQRNFQGMTTGGGLDLIGVGASSISQLAGIGFLQNVRELKDYTARLEGGQSPIFRGLRLSTDDLVRQQVLQQLYCEAEIRPADIEQRCNITFADYFAREMEIMRELQRDGLVELAGDGRIALAMPLGRVLMRTVAAVFDAYLAPDAYRAGDREYFSANA
jgi:oxygen-independent coproporphyrinogen-3 oxidase